MPTLRFTDIAGQDVVNAWVEQASTLPVITQRLFLTAVASNQTISQARQAYGLTYEQAMGLMAKGKA